MAIQLTERAAEEVLAIINNQKSSPESTFLRVGVKGGGCGGFTYSLDLVDGKGDADEAFDSHGIKVVCDPKSYIYLNGTTVDYKDDLMGRGFAFENPNASNTCGCGDSFTA